MVYSNKGFYVRRYVILLKSDKGIMMPESEILAKNLKNIRKKMKKSQIDFAAECGISKEIVSLLERQKTDPKLSTIQKIAAYTDYSVAELLTKDKRKADVKDIKKL